MFNIKTTLHLGLLALALLTNPAFADEKEGKAYALKESSVTKLIKTDTQIGTGAEALSRKKVIINYTAWVYSTDADKPDHKGVKFDSSIDRKEPYIFRLDIGDVIRGLDEGIVGMKVGGKRTLFIPPELGYGSHPIVRIPSNAALVFDIELIDVLK